MVALSQPVGCVAGCQQSRPTTRGATSSSSVAITALIWPALCGCLFQLRCATPCRFHPCPLLTVDHRCIINSIDPRPWWSTSSTTGWWEWASSSGMKSACPTAPKPWWITINGRDYWTWHGGVSRPKWAPGCITSARWRRFTTVSWRRVAILITPL